MAYDVVIEDFILARQKVKRSQRSFGRELAEMVRYGVGYKSRAFVTFGTPIPVDGYDPHSRSDVLDLAHRTRHAIGLLAKVLPTAVVAAAMRPSITRRELESRVAEIIEVLAATGANMGVFDPRDTVERAARDFVVARRAGAGARALPHPRAERAPLLRAIARAPAAHAGRPDALMIDALSKASFHALARSRMLKRLASRYGLAHPHSFARRFIAGETLEEAIAAARAVEARGLAHHARLPRRERLHAGGSRRRRPASTSACST